MTATYGSLLDGTTSPGPFSWRGAKTRDLAGEADGPGVGGLRQRSDGDPVQASAVLDVLRDAVSHALSFAVVVRDDLGVSGFDGSL